MLVDEYKKILIELCVWSYEEGYKHALELLEVVTKRKIESDKLKAGLEERFKYLDLFK